MKWLVIGVAATGGFAVLPAPALALPHLSDSLSRLTPSHFASCTTVSDDPLEDVVILSTRNSGKREGPARGAHVDDAHLRVIVDRATGDAPGQCNQMTSVVFELPEEHIRQIAQNRRAGSREPWLMRFKDRNGESVTIGFAKVGIVGMVDAYENWRQGSI